MATRRTQMELALSTDRSVVVFGGDIPVARLLDICGGPKGVEPIDARSRTLQGTVRELRQTVMDRLKKRPLVVFLLGTHVPDEVRTVMAELADGRINLEGATVPASARLLAVSPTEDPDEGVTELFASRLRGRDAFRLVEVG